MALGRISGEMLEQNLNLTGNLTFNTDALTIATDGKIGIKNTTPGVELDVTGTARANTVTVLGDLSMEWTMTMDAQDNLNFAYNNNTLISFDSFGNITSGSSSLGDNQKEFTATGAISAGEVVSLKSDGTVEVTSIITNTQTENLGTLKVFETGLNTAYVSATFDSNSNRIVIAYQDGANSNYGTAVVGTVNPVDDSITFGTQEVFEFDNADYISATFDSNSNRIVIAYRDGANSNHGTAVVGTVNPTDDSITFGTPEVFEFATTTYISATFDSNSNRIVIAYTDSGNSLRGTAVVGTVNPADDSITFGTPKVFETGQTLWISATFDWFHDRIVISYRDNSEFPDYGTAVVGTVNSVDDSITFGTPEVFEFGSTIYTSITFDSYINKVVVAYTDTDNLLCGTSALGTVNPADNSITFETPVVYETSSAIYNSATFDSNSNKVVIAYQDEGNGHRGTGFVYTPANIATTNADSWIGIAAEDIADTATGKVDLTGAINRSQTGLASNSIYYIDESGNLTTTATDYMLGRAISTTDIQIFGKAISEFSAAIDVDFTTNTPTTTSGLVLTSDGDSSYSFQAPVVTTQLYQLTDVDFTTNTPTTTSGLVLTSDGDSTYSFQTPVVTTQIADLTDVDFTTNTPTTTSGLVLTSDGDSSYSFQPAKTDKETVQIIALAATVDLDIKDDQIFYQTSDSTQNWTINVRGDATTTLNSYLATNESITVVYMATQGTTAYYPTQLQIDGVNVTPVWSFGNAPVAGTASAIDVYSYTITKTADATYTVLANASFYQ